jgi:hypothetical protein|tara:strand:- start:1097 stop:1846 length:750 start_codon:yes stop_codon:yes gene_type:complete
MLVYLAGEVYGKELFQEVGYNFNRLDSFFYTKKSKLWTEKIVNYNNHILDSGAFTFIMAKSSKKVDIDSFTDEYIDYINHNNIELFFEMDVDSIFGYDKVKKLRARIERNTGKRSIPVFHTKRGLDDWKYICKDYDYIALGIAGKDVAWGDADAFHRFVLSAQEHNTNVHGLGITGMKSLRKVPFYSVDSSSWTSGNRYGGAMHFFNGKEIKIKPKPAGLKISNHYALARHNLKSWMAFAESLKNKKII